MSELRDLHHKAMDLADQAQDAMRRGEESVANRYFAEAYELDNQAAALVVDRGCKS